MSCPRPHKKCIEVECGGCIDGYCQGRIENNPDLVPCERKLPPDRGFYIVSISDKSVSGMYYDGTFFYTLLNNRPMHPGRDIIAWMPLPEYYK